MTHCFILFVVVSAAGRVSGLHLRINSILVS